MLILFLSSEASKHMITSTILYTLYPHAGLLQPGLLCGIIYIVSLSTRQKRSKSFWLNTKGFVSYTVYMPFPLRYCFSTFFLFILCCPLLSPVLPARPWQSISLTDPCLAGHWQVSRFRTPLPPSFSAHQPPVGSGPSFNSIGEHTEPRRDQYTRELPESKVRRRLMVGSRG